jgi:DNA polymerase-3 subunit alpha (Gram-positive type)
MTGMGFSDARAGRHPLYFRTTKDMLDAFSCLGEQKAYRWWWRNTRKIASLCEAVRPSLQTSGPPNIENAPGSLMRLSREKAFAIYGNPLPPIVEERMQKEL